MFFAIVNGEGPKEACVFNVFEKKKILAFEIILQHLLFSTALFPSMFSLMC